MKEIFSVSSWWALIVIGMLFLGVLVQGWREHRGHDDAPQTGIGDSQHLLHH